MLKIRKFVQRIIESLVYGTIFLLICIACDQNQVSKPVIDLVDPFLGAPILDQEAPSLSSNYPPVPCIGRPFGMAHWTPETRTKSDSCGLPYSKDDSRIQGFRLHHISQQACTREYGSMTLMMSTGKIQKAPPMRSSTFERKGKESNPGYLGVDLTDYGILAEMTTSARVGFLRFQFSKKDTAYLFIKTHNVQGNAQVNLYRHAGEIWVRDSIPPIYENWPASGAINAHYVLQIRKAVSGYGIWEGELIQPNAIELRGSGDRKGFYVKFPVDAGEIVQIKVGTSYWNSIAARRSISEEIPNWNFDQISASAKNSWTEIFDRFSLHADDKTSARFYQSLYCASLMPRIFSGSDGLYPAFAEEPFPYKMESGDFYGDLSMWNSLNDPHPQFLAFAYPERMNDIQASFELLQNQADSLSIFPEANQPTAQASLPNLTSETLFQILGLVPSKHSVGSFNIQLPAIEGWTLQLGKDNTFQVVVDNYQEGRGEIESATLNGRLLEKHELSLADIHAGGKLEIVFR